MACRNGSARPAAWKSPKHWHSDAAEPPLGRGKRGSTRIASRIAAGAGSAEYSERSAFRVYVGNGEYVGARSIEGAEEIAARERLRESSGAPRPDRKVTLHELIEEVRESSRARLSARSLESTEYALTLLDDALGRFKPAEISADRLALLRRDLASGKITGRPLSGASIARYEQTFKLVFKLAVRRGAILTSPYELLGPEDRVRSETGRKRFEWSREAIASLLTAARQLDARRHARQHYLPLIATLVYTGLRFGEAQALTWGDVDVLNATITVERSRGRDGQIGAPKTRGSVRRIPIPRALVEILLDAKPVDAADSDFCFPARHGNGPISYHNFRDRGFLQALRVAGLDGQGIRVYDLRHCAASLLIAEGLSPVDVAAHLGHSNPHTTLKTYAHLFDRAETEQRIRTALDSVEGSDRPRLTLVAADGVA